MQRIIPATKDHIPAIIELWKELMDYIAELEPHFKRSSDGHLNFEKYLKGSLESENAVVLVAEIENETIGFCMAHITDFFPVINNTTYGFISDLMVKKEHQRRGTGTKLVTEARKWFYNRGISRIELRVMYKNVIGFEFWKKMGFKEYEYTMHIDLK